MKATPVRQSSSLIEVSAPSTELSADPPHAGPTSLEAAAIAAAVAPHVAQYASLYDEKKYRPEVYQDVLSAFARPRSVPPRAFRDALMWKYGHLGKERMPRQHERLIAQIRISWPEVCHRLPERPAEVFDLLNDAFGGKGRFVTVAFVTHLVRPDEVPIIDQHNFRAVNQLMRGARRTWRVKARPSRYEDLAIVAAFVDDVVGALNQSPRSPPVSRRELDKFLMMYGKSIKPHPR